MALTAALSFGRYITMVTLLAVTPDQVAPPLSPPAHLGRHGRWSARPVMQNFWPVVLPDASVLVPPPPPAAPVAPGPVAPVVVPVAPGTPVVPGAPVPTAPLTPEPGTPEEAAGPPWNCPPSCVPPLDPWDGATSTNTICVATSSAKGA